MTSAAPDTPSSTAPRPIWREIDAPRSLRRTLSLNTGGPTTRRTDGRFLRATYTPDGPATILLRWTADPVAVADAGLTADAWGPGADWLLARVDDITGATDRTGVFDHAHPVVERSLRLSRGGRIAASGDLYHQLLPTIIGQRITGGEAARQWRELCRALGEPAPGPPEIVGDLRLPPSPDSLYRRPAWWFHPLGIETSRARPLTEVARHADKLWGWAEAGSAVVNEKLQLLPRIGPWTVGSVLGPALGDPDAVPVGDYHFPNVVAYALAGEPRADDDRMLELLEPYRGQRGRVLWALVSVAGPAPKYGPRQRVLPMARW